MSGTDSVAALFIKLAQGIQQHPEQVKEIGGIYLFRITGEENLIVWVNLKDQPQLLYEEREAECVIEARDKDFLKVYKGIIPGFKAVLSGKLKVSGKLELATRLGEVFEKTRAKPEIKKA